MSAYWISAVLEEKGLSAKELGDVLGLQRSNAAKLARGERSLKATEIKQVATFLGLSEAEVLKYIETANSPKNNWVREELTARGISINSFASVLGVSQSVASRKASGESALTTGDIEKIAPVFGMTIEDAVIRNNKSKLNPPASERSSSDPLLSQRNTSNLIPLFRVVDTTVLRLAAKPFDALPRPAILAASPDAYAFIVSAQMHCGRFHEGELIVADPARANGIGVDVVAMQAQNTPQQEVSLMRIMDITSRGYVLKPLRGGTPAIKADRSNIVLHRILKVADFFPKISG